MRKRMILAVGWLVASGPAAVALGLQDDRRSPEVRAQIAAAEQDLAHWTASELIPFADEADFRAYVRAARKLEETRWGSVHDRGIQLAQAQSGTQSDASQQICAPDDKRCRLEQGPETVTVTGSRIRQPPLTNNQEQGVDEGDVVKQIGQYLLVLQDGRIFVVDTQGGADRRQLVLVDRANAYRNANEDAWYDELVVYDDRIVVTGYSYLRSASEIVVFRLGRGGHLTREAAFELHSADYYDRNNYASRLVGDRLVLYTPVPALDEDGFDWPTLQRVDTADGRGVQLLRPQQLFRPLGTLHRPVIHMITTCRLGPTAAASLRCETNGFVGSSTRQFYVSGEEAFLWSYSNDEDWEARYGYDDDAVPLCPERDHAIRRIVDAAIIYRVGLTRGDVRIAGANGFPFDQLGIDYSDGHFRALVGWVPNGCRANKAIPLTFVDIPSAAFDRSLRPVSDSAFTPMPGIAANRIENRFTDRYLVFGGRSGEGAERDMPDGSVGGGPIVIVPLAAPALAQRLEVPHRVWRVERIGDNVAITGYRGADGLHLSTVDLRGRLPRLADTVRLDGRFESEGRSHAFNSLIRADGSGLLGLPTVLRREESARTSWYSSPSDLSFLSVDADGVLHSLGALEPRSQRGSSWDFDPDRRRPRDADDYVCEVSCIDWYGNSRALFTDGRVFALTATELVEGHIARGRIAEARRLDLTRAIGTSSAN